EPAHTSLLLNHSISSGGPMSLRHMTLASSALLLLALACAPGGQAAGPGPAAAAPPAQAPPAGGPAAPPREADPDDALCAPLLLENDLGFGTHVVLRRLPDARDMDELRQLDGLRQVVVALPEWPADFEALRPLHQAVLPDGAELVVLLP